MEKIKLVVFKEHTLGYILPELPNQVCHLYASILKGATCSRLAGSTFINNPSDVRLASEKDFENFNVSFNGYKTDEKYEYVDTFISSNVQKPPFKVVVEVKNLDGSIREYMFHEKENDGYDFLNEKPMNIHLISNFSEEVLWRTCKKNPMK